MTWVELNQRFELADVEEVQGRMVADLSASPQMERRSSTAAETEG